jgi:hypothetical protein
VKYRAATAIAKPGLLKYFQKITNKVNILEFNLKIGYFKLEVRQQWRLQDIKR